MKNRIKFEDALETVGVSVEKVCAIANRSRTSFTNANNGEASDDTKKEFRKALKQLKAERQKALAELDIDLVG